MQDYNLLNPGFVQNTQKLRREVAYAISQVQLHPGLPNGKALADFLSHSATVTPGYTGPVLPATQAVVSHGGTVVVKDADNSPSAVNGTYTVSANAVVDVTLALGTTGLARDGQTVSVVAGATAGNTPVTGTHLFKVDLGVVRCKLDPVIAPLANGVKVPCGTITGSGSFFTPTIVNGVITGGVLSAS